MFGFLLKVLLIAAVVGSVVGVVYMRRGSMPSISSLRDSLSHVDFSIVWKNLSLSLDSLVTNPSSNSPVVLGVKITNDSISSVVDVIHSLPPDQIDQIKAGLCAPLASPSAR